MFDNFINKLMCVLNERHMNLAQLSRAIGYVGTSLYLYIRDKHLSIGMITAIADYFGMAAVYTDGKWDLVEKERKAWE